MTVQDFRALGDGLTGAVERFSKTLEYQERYGYFRCGVAFLTETQVFGIVGMDALHNDVIKEHPYLKNNKRQCTMEFFWPPDAPDKVEIWQARVTHAPWFDLEDAIRRTREWLTAQRGLFGG